jgi:hypothetical protein
MASSASIGLSSPTKGLGFFRPLLPLSGDTLEASQLHRQDTATNGSTVPQRRSLKRQTIPSFAIKVETPMKKTASPPTYSKYLAATPKTPSKSPLQVKKVRENCHAFGLKYNTLSWRKHLNKENLRPSILEPSATAPHENQLDLTQTQGAEPSFTRSAKSLFCRPSLDLQRPSMPTLISFQRSASAMEAAVEDLELNQHSRRRSRSKRVFTRVLGGFAAKSRTSPQQGSQEQISVPRPRTPDNIPSTPPVHDISSFFPDMTSTPRHPTDAQNVLDFLDEDWEALLDEEPHGSAPVGGAMPPTPPNSHRGLTLTTAFSAHTQQNMKGSILRLQVSVACDPEHASFSSEAAIWASIQVRGEIHSSVNNAVINGNRALTIAVVIDNS